MLGLHADISATGFIGCHGLSCHCMHARNPYTRSRGAQAALWPQSEPSSKLWRARDGFNTFTADSTLVRKTARRLMQWQSSSVVLHCCPMAMQFPAQANKLSNVHTAGLTTQCQWGCPEAAVCFWTCQQCVPCLSSQVSAQVLRMGPTVESPPVNLSPVHICTLTHDQASVRPLCMVAAAALHDAAGPEPGGADADAEPAHDSVPGVQFNLLLACFMVQMGQLLPGVRQDPAGPAAQAAKVCCSAKLPVSAAEPQSSLGLQSMQRPKPHDTTLAVSALKLDSCQ